MNLWLARHMRLPIAELLCKTVMPNPTCPICSEYIETSLHVLRDCHWASKVWKGLMVSNQVPNFWIEENTRVWIDVNLSHISIRLWDCYTVEDNLPHCHPCALVLEKQTDL